MADSDDPTMKWMRATFATTILNCMRRIESKSEPKCNCTVLRDTTGCVWNSFPRASEAAYAMCCCYRMGGLDHDALIRLLVSVSANVIFRPHVDARWAGDGRQVRGNEKVPRDLHGNASMERDTIKGCSRNCIPQPTQLTPLTVNHSVASYWSSFTDNLR